MSRATLKIVKSTSVPAAPHAPFPVFGTAPAPFRLPVFTSGIACPGCGRGNWSVGRCTAECGHCATVLPV